MRSMVEGERGTGSDRGDYSLDTSQNIHRAHPHDPVPVIVQKLVASSIAFLARFPTVRLAIDLNDELGAEATEIGDIWADGMLPAELEPGAISSQFLPKEDLWQRHGPSQLSCGGNLGPLHLPRSPSTAFGGPPPRSGEDFTAALDSPPCRPESGGSHRRFPRPAPASQLPCPRRPRGSCRGCARTGPRRRSTGGWWCCGGRRS